MIKKLELNWNNSFYTFNLSIIRRNLKMINNKLKMKSRILLFVLATLVYYWSSSGTLSYSTSDWISYENNASYKWCRYSTSTYYGYYCPSSDSTTYWGGSSSYRCSTDSSYLPNNAKKLLCPTDSTYCSSVGLVSN